MCSTRLSSSAMPDSIACPLADLAFPQVLGSVQLAVVPEGGATRGNACRGR